MKFMVSIFDGGEVPDISQPWASIIYLGTVSSAEFEVLSRIAARERLGIVCHPTIEMEESNGG